MKNKQQRLWLITTAFFFFLAFYSYSTRVLSFEQSLPDILPYVGAKQTGADDLYSCRTSDSEQVSFGLPMSKVSYDSCVSAVQSLVDYNCSNSDRSGFHSCYNNTLYTNSNGYTYVQFKYCYSKSYCGDLSASYGPIYKDGRLDGSYVCPPDGFPAYTFGPVTSYDGTADNVCYPEEEQCPLGYYPAKVRGQCVPLKCDDAGLKKTIYDMGMHVPFGASGTYCDGRCSWSVDASSKPYTGSNVVTGVSLGAQCGTDFSATSGSFVEGTPDENGCERQKLSTGATFLTCANQSDEDDPDAEDTPPGMDPDALADLEQKQEDVPKHAFEECSMEGDVLTCVGKNLNDAINDSTETQAKLAAERHNKMVKAQKEVTEWLDNQQEARQKRADTNAAMVGQAVNALGTQIAQGGGISGDTQILGALEGLDEGLNETDVETDSEPSGNLQQIYEPEYPNGFSDVWDKNRTVFENTEAYQYIQSWKVTVSGAPPSFDMCFNLGANMNFGCDTFEIDSRIFPFLRIIMLVCTAFLCRALIFGG